MENITFKEAKKKNFTKLKQYVPVVARVHGANHPEFYEVQKWSDIIIEKTKAAKANTADLKEEFARLREITNNYTVPQDTCESYEAVYNMLEEIDKAYHA